MCVAVANAYLAPCFAAPERTGPRALEILFGMEVKLAEQPQDIWAQVVIPGGEVVYTSAEILEADEEQVKLWQRYAKQVVRAPWLDVMLEPDVRSARVQCIPRGGRVHPVGEIENGWQAVTLPDGRSGFVRSGNLMPYITNWRVSEEKTLREALATSAMSYLGVQYRFGGRSPMGVDAPGLVLLAGMLNGVAFPEGTTFVPDGDAHEIDRARLGMGDVVYFEGHVGMYLGEDKYVHATPHGGSDGVVINSLNPDSPFYREDLAQKLVCCASVF